MTGRTRRIALLLGGAAPLAALVSAGIAPAQELETSRIEEAKRLLALCERPIKGVALACGFAHANSFARAFRRSTGISPQSFRQRALPSGPPALNPPAL